MLRKIGILLFGIFNVSVGLSSVHAQRIIGGQKQNISLEKNDPRAVEHKMGAWMQLVRHVYVEEVDMLPIIEKGMTEMLKQLDPHSVYISAKDVERSNEPLVGNFDGIGVSFQVLNDTIVIIDVISGGPSEKLGILPGDKIVRIDTLGATKDSATTDFVFRHLRGKKGSMVEVEIKRKGVDKGLVYKIIRDKIPLTSVDTYFMIDKKNGYIRLDRFSRTTMEEIRKALAELKGQGMQNLIFDLRGNSGGYLDVAVELADEFLPEEKLVVYMKGKAQPRQEFISTSKGDFEKGRLVVLIDEGSASASEIVSGAVQDWDRAILVGRRSFGKGLVQRPFDLPDQSNIRLTTARYYTPSGRCIQKPYNDGLESYYSDIMNRYTHGEMLHPDSVALPDSLKYFSAGRRVVYGGGGIMPDIFVAIDTQRISDYYVDLLRNNTLNKYVMETLDKNRATLQKDYPDFKTFYENFKIDEKVMNDFYKYAGTQGVNHRNFKVEKADVYLKDLIKEMEADTTLLASKNYEEYMKKVWWSEEKIGEFLRKKAIEEDQRQIESNRKSDEYIEVQLKALFARNLYGMPYYYQVVKDIDKGYKQALEALENKKLFDKLNIQY
ncbi:MAG: S41 family peptidase [Bacteroidales bacterium]